MIKYNNNKYKKKLPTQQVSAIRFSHSLLDMGVCLF